MRYLIAVIILTLCSIVKADIVGVSFETGQSYNYLDGKSLYGGRIGLVTAINKTGLGFEYGHIFSKTPYDKLGILLVPSTDLKVRLSYGACVENKKHITSYVGIGCYPFYLGIKGPRYSPLSIDVHYSFNNIISVSVSGATPNIFAGAMGERKDCVWSFIGLCTAFALESILVASSSILGK